MSVTSGQNLPLTALQQIEAAALQLLAAVRAAGDGFLSPAPDRTLAHTPALSLADLCNEFLIAKARAARSVRYLGLLHKQLSAFTAGRLERTVAGVGASEIENWLYERPWSAKTRHGSLLTLRNVFGFAVARGYLVANPALAVDLPSLVPVEKGVHSPSQVRHVLASCHDPSTLRFLAIRYFAGLRGTEAGELQEDAIRPERRVIEVCAASAKTRRRRLVTIQPNLAAWLDASQRDGGSLPLKQMHNRMRAAVSQSGTVWPDNVTRHSFCSYHLAHFQNAGKTALEAGHREDQLFANYRELRTVDGQIVTPEVAAEFWGIAPSGKVPSGFSP